MSNNNNPQTMEEQFKKLKNAYIKLKNNFQIEQGIKKRLEDENKILKNKIEELEKKIKHLNVNDNGEGNKDEKKRENIEDE